VNADIATPFVLFTTNCMSSRPALRTLRYGLYEMYLLVDTTSGAAKSQYLTKLCTMW